MLEKKYRLPSFCFKKLYQKGRTIKGRLATLKLLPNSKEISRFGFVISRSDIKKATQRNLQRRRASEIIKSYLSQIKPGFDFVLIIKKETDFEELNKEIKSLLNV